jgi:hypothetical protein
MTLLLCRNCTSSYESDKIVRFSALVGILEIYKKINKSVKNFSTLGQIYFGTVRT